MSGDKFFHCMAFPCKVSTHIKSFPFIGISMNMTDGWTSLLHLWRSTFNAHFYHFFCISSPNPPFLPINILLILALAQDYKQHISVLPLSFILHLFFLLFLIFHLLSTLVRTPCFGRVIFMVKEKFLILFCILWGSFKWVGSFLRIQVLWWQASEKFRGNCYKIY